MSHGSVLQPEIIGRLRAVCRHSILGRALSLRRNALQSTGVESKCNRTDAMARVPLQCTSPTTHCRPEYCCIPCQCALYRPQTWTHYLPALFTSQRRGTNGGHAHARHLLGNAMCTHCQCAHVKYGQRPGRGAGAESPQHRASIINHPLLYLKC